MYVNYCTQHTTSSNVLSMKKNANTGIASLYSRFVDSNYVAIFILTATLYFAYDKLIYNIASETAREFINAAIGVIFVVITTMFMLRRQSEVDQKKELNSEIFKKKLEIYEDALNIWKAVGFAEGKVTDTDFSACIETQLRLNMVAPKSVIEVSTTITTKIVSVFTSLEKLDFDQDEKIELFKLLGDFSDKCRSDLDLPTSNTDVGASIEMEMKDALTKAAGFRNKNYDKFAFNGNVFSKRQLVLAVVKHVTNASSVNNFKELKNIFPDTWANGGVTSKGRQCFVVELEEDAQEKNARYFSATKDILVMPSGENVVVNDQWGTNTDYFVDKVSSELGLIIDRIARS